MDLIENIIAEAQKNLQRIVLPEGAEDRVLRAADVALSRKMANITLIGNEKEIMEKAKNFGLQHISEATIFDPQINPKQQEYTQLLFNLRKDKGLTIEEAASLAENPLYLGCLMIKNGDADGEVAGAINLTSNVLRPAFQIIKTKPGISVVSGVMLMFTGKKEYGNDGLLIFADCAVNPFPTSMELAQIAVCTGETTRKIARMEPQIAMLSFSTKGSAKHDLVTRVQEATRLAQKMAPDLKIEGELQSDAAIVPSVAENKAPGSKIAGHANVLIFPDLQAGNIAYKLVQRLSNTQAIGPILQGMAAPVNDLSRGCSVDDVVKMIAITSIQAIDRKELK